MDRSEADRVTPQAGWTCIHADEGDSYDLGC
jgi:hypothetical protein